MFVFRPGHLLLLLLLAAGAWAEDPFAATNPVDNPYFPFRAGARLRYSTRSSLDPNAVLRWELGYLRSSDGPAGTERVTVRAQADGWLRANPIQRQERYLRDPRGIFTPTLTGGVEDEAFGPYPLLPSPGELEQVDQVWQYEGTRALPFAFYLLGLIRNTDLPVATSGHYHVLDLDSLETEAGTFAQAVQVTAIERVAMVLLGPDPEDVLLRCRRFYVRGLGLAQEDIEFLDLPRLGVLQTVVTGYEGLTPRLAPPPATVARAGTDHPVE